MRAAHDDFRIPANAAHTPDAEGGGSASPIKR
jgi:hypothetical protein